MSKQLNAIYSFCLVVALSLSTKPNASEQPDQTPSDKLNQLIESRTKTCLSEECSNKIKQLRKYARWNEAKAQLVLGIAYLYGDGVEQNTNEALKWLIRTSRNKQPDAKRYALKTMHILEMLYRQGIGVEVNQRQADYYQKRLLKHSYGPTLHQVALNSLADNPAKALDYLRLADKQKHSPSTYLLAQLYHTGNGVELNLLTAAIYYESLAISNYKDSRKQLSSITKQLSKLNSSDFQQNITKFERTLGMEVITVNPNNMGSQDKLTSMLSMFKEGDGKGINKYKSTGSHLRGQRCGSTSYMCTSSDGWDDLEGTGILGRAAIPSAPSGL